MALFGCYSQGSVVDGCIQCPYHGWQYDGSGACTRMPSTAFCRGVSVSSLPVAESEGFVWVWPGSDVPSDLAPEPTRPPDNFTVASHGWPLLYGCLHDRCVVMNIVIVVNVCLGPVQHAVCRQCHLKASGNMLARQPGA